jgi:tetratricopeptide (TPR) repeat protein
MRWALLAIAVAMTPALADDLKSDDVLKGTPPLDAAAMPMCGGDMAAPKTATILSGYGGGGFPIRTKVARSQAFFDNGMQLAHAFAHRAAIQAFHEAARLDPTCAMCLWGEAWAAGPTINYPIPPEDETKLAALVPRARALSADAPARERALIAALEPRYRNGGGKGAGDRAFATAMAALAARYPTDDEIAVIAADAWMIPSALSNSKANMGKAVALLEGVLRRNPNYTPAIHFYVHATEVAGYPERAEPYADRLAMLAPSAAHLVHMPSHTYYHVGRYQDAADANVKAVALGIANAKRLGLAEPDGVWDLPYHAHNVQYGVGGALLSGDGKAALALSDPLIARAGAAMPKGKDSPPFAQMVAGTGYFAEARFADPHKILNLPAPSVPYAKAYWHYARGEAAARLADAALVRKEAALIPDHVGPEKEEDASSGAANMMRIARQVLNGRAAMLDKQPARALIAFKAAAKMQETRAFLSFSDPPAFWYPVRRDMAAALLAMGEYKHALREIERTLKATPHEPVTLALKAQVETRLGQRAAAAADRGAALALWHGDRAMLPDPREQWAAR